MKNNDLKIKELEEQINQIEKSQYQNWLSQMGLKL